MKRITHRIRWLIALIADLAIFIPSSIKTGFWQRLANVESWTLVFWVSAFGLIALTIVQLWEWLESHSTPQVDLDALLTSERIERDRLLDAESQERNRLIDCVNYKVDDWLQRTNKTLNSLIPKPEPEPTLKQKIISLHDRLGTFEQEYDNKFHLERAPSESNEEFVTRVGGNAIVRYTQMSADFRIQLENDMRNVNNQIELRSGVRSLANVIDQAARACNTKTIKDMREQLWECAREMEPS
jgi:hypothetical protein